MNFGTAVLVMALVCAGAAEKWQWPDTAASVRIDTKVRFIDDESHKDHKDRHHDQRVQADEPQFQEPSNTEGFYNRPRDDGRFPVRVESYRAPYKVDGHGIYHTRKSPHYYSDGTLDSLQYCKCVTTPDCNPHYDSAKACGEGKYLCCYKRPNKNAQKNTEFFNEVEDERPVLLPGQGELAGPFPPPAETLINGMFGPGQGDAALLGAVSGQAPNKQVLVGPGGPTGIIGPGKNRGLLVGPGGPTGVIGPQQNRGVLTGPGGPTGIIGPGQNIGVLVGPEGPTGVIGPQQNRGVLVGPEGPTGIIGPQQNRGVLTGPGGPTGIIGPRPANADYSYLIDNQEASETAQRGVLVGPGGPTGIIGPTTYGRRPVLVGGGGAGLIGPYGGRRGPGVLVGPGGPTGIIGPPRRRPFYYGK